MARAWCESVALVGLALHPEHPSFPPQHFGGHTLLQIRSLDLCETFVDQDETPATSPLRATPRARTALK
jgi:hypothetical protein